MLSFVSALALCLLPLSEARYTRGFSNNTQGNTQGCVAGGKPTSFTKSGCFKLSKIHDRIDYTGARAVTPDGCFSFCMEKWEKGMQFFGVEKAYGKRSGCFCAKLHEGTRKETCDEPCAGDKKIMCGSIDNTDMYIMFDCTPPTLEERKATAAAAEAKVLGAYASFTAQTCGKSEGNLLKISGSPTFVGSVDECKKQCYGALECHGFTYESAVSKCTFHSDVLDGKVEKKKKTDCFYKKLGLIETKVTEHKQ